MNLRCNEVELIQTPTWLSRIALYDSNNMVRPVEETTHIYKAWVRSLLNGAWTEADRDRREWLYDHIDVISEQEIKEYWEI